MKRRLSRRRLLALLAAALSVPLNPARMRAQTFDPGTWLEATSDVELWVGPDAAAPSLGLAPAGSLFEVIGPGDGQRIYVNEAATGVLGWVDTGLLRVADVAAVPRPTVPPSAASGNTISTAIPTVAPTATPQPTLEPTPEPTAAATPTETAEFKPWWVLSYKEGYLYDSDEARARRVAKVVIGKLFMVLEPQTGDRLHVMAVEMKREGWIDAAIVGPVGGPYLASLRADGWRGFVGAETANVRAAPYTFTDLREELRRGDPVQVLEWVLGEEVIKDNATWGKLADDRYIYSALLRREPLAGPPPPPPDAPREGRWIDVNLSLQVVTAYEGATPVRAVLTSSGRPTWETPTGKFKILRRVEKEVMDSNTLLGQDLANRQNASYRVENVRWTQYITNDGVALHENYWRDPDLFGIPSSHGCLGLRPDDAKWFWDWATIGTPVVVHY